MWLSLLPFITPLDSWNSVCNLRPQIRSVSHLFPIIPPVKGWNHIWSSGPSAGPAAWIGHAGSGLGIKTGQLAALGAARTGDRDKPSTNKYHFTTGTFWKYSNQAMGIATRAFIYIHIYIYFWFFKPSYRDVYNLLNTNLWWVLPPLSLSTFSQCCLLPS